MRPILVTFGLAVLLGLTVAYAQSVLQAPAMNAIPETVTIRATMADDARLCIEPRGGGLVSCRRVGDVRAWILQRSAK